jgi:hypothetical protein
MVVTVLSAVCALVALYGIFQGRAASTRAGACIGFILALMAFVVSLGWLHL